MFKIAIAGCQQVAHTSGNSTASGAVIGSKSCVLYSTQDCIVAIAASPTAPADGAAGLFVPANTFLELNTVGSEQMKIAARSLSTSGILYISPLAQ
jgi:hypothetical protein